MERLPEELLMEIFTYLNCKDLCQLISTCKSFNDIISNSSTLMDKFRLICGIWNKIMQRKYQRIKIMDVNEGLFKLLECCGENIIDIIIPFINKNSRYLRRILNFCPNLKQLKIYRSRLNDDLIELLSKFSFDLFFVEYRELFFELLPESKGKILELKSSVISKKLLISCIKQNQLKHLEVRDYRLFDDDSLVNVEFQLETLIFETRFISHVNEVNFKKFLGNQKNLSRLIVIPNYLDCINSFGYGDVLKNVKELMALGPFTDFHAMPQIEILTVKIHFCINQNFQELFPNLKNLSINTIKKIKIVKNFTEPASKECIEVKISENVKTLAVKYNKFENDSLFGDDVDIKIENLTIYECGNIDWLIDCIKNDRIKLKSLIINRSIMKKNQKVYLENLTRGENKKIEKLKIHMLMKLNENHNYVYRYAMKDGFNAKRIKLN